MVKKGEDVCWNCTGVTFYNEELLKLGKRPKCYGIEYKATVPIPPEKMEALDQVPKLPSNTKVFLIGHSQASAKMHQQGQTPVLRYGIEISMVQEPTTEASSGARNNNVDRRSSSRTSMMDSTPLSPPSTSSSNGKAVQPAAKTTDNDDVLIIPQSHNNNNNLLDISNQAWAKYKRSSLRLLSTMDRVWRQSTTNLPDRFSRSFMKLGGSCQRTFEIMVHRMQIAVGFEDDGKRKPPHK